MNIKEETFIRQGRMEQAVDNLTEWINKCNPDSDGKLISILYTKLNNLLIKLNFIKQYQNGKKTEKNTTS